MYYLLVLIVSLGLFNAIVTRGMNTLTEVFDLTPHFELQSSNGGATEARFLNNGKEILLSLDANAGGNALITTPLEPIVPPLSSGFESYDEYLFGIFHMRIKLQAGDSAGVVTTYYMSSLGLDHDELDFEFLGNVTGQPIILQTNHFVDGVGGHEQRIFLWFDPTADFHDYSFLWNRYHIVFFVDQVPIRVYPNIEATTGVPYIKSRAMGLYGTIWNGENWATEGGRIKIDWMHAPFTASYTGFSFDACSGDNQATSCGWTKWWNQGPYVALNANQTSLLQWVRENWMIYDYCWDKTRYNVTPVECFYTSTTTEAWPQSPPATSSPSTSPSYHDASPNTIASGAPSSSPTHTNFSLAPSPNNLAPTVTNSLNELSSNKLQMSLSPPISYTNPWSTVVLFILGYLFS